MAADIRSTEPDDVIEFAYLGDDFDSVAKPEPAHDRLPDWYENLEYTFDLPEGQEGEVGKTVKTCVSFLEALTAGWIIPLPSDLTVEFGEDNRSMRQSPAGDASFELHGVDQLGGEDHPLMPDPIVKFVTNWMIKTPDGYSTLFVSPLNRSEDRWQTFSGVIDTDEYYNRNGIFPALWTKPGYSGTIEKGTPIVQAIPFKREDFNIDGVVRPASTKERMISETVTEDLNDERVNYREDFWVPQRQSRDLSERHDT